MMSNSIPFDQYIKVVQQHDFYRREGKISQVIGLTIQVEGIKAFVGELCKIYIEGGPVVDAEVVGFSEDKVLVMPLGELAGISPGSRVYATGQTLTVKVGENLRGKVLDGLGRPMDGEDIPLNEEVSIYNKPSNPFTRQPIGTPMKTGVRAIDGMLTVAQGQRMGIFAGSGVGKSTLIGKICKNSSADINVVCLLGERNRELQDVLYHDLGEEGLKRSVVVCATSDQPALVRLKSAYVATSVAEYFRDRGYNVMLVMDSVTRFAMAQREIGLAIGEPPATKGYTPSVFAALPKLLERSGTGEIGSITAFYAVLVEGDDFNEPISDTVRGILDGHILLSRKLAAKNHFPAIDVSGSISRVMGAVTSKEHRAVAGEIRNCLATYEKSEDLISVGAYVPGANPSLDKAVKLYDPINQFLKQTNEETTPFEETVELMKAIVL